MATPRFRCSLCKRVLPAHYFSKLTRSTRGYREACKACLNAKQNARNPTHVPPMYRYWIGTPDGLVQGYPCKDCRIILPLSMFGSNLQRNRGHRYVCKPCYAAARREFNAQRREHVRQVSKQWRDNNKDKIHDFNQTAYAKMMADAEKRARMYAATAAWYDRNPHVVQTKNAMRDARYRGAALRDLTRAEWNEIKAAYDYCCAYCGIRPAKLTMDHVIPLSKGGNHTKDNIVPACMSCNSRKRDKIIDTNGILKT